MIGITSRLSARVGEYFENRISPQELHPSFFRQKAWLSPTQCVKLPSHPVHADVPIHVSNLHFFSLSGQLLQIVGPLIMFSTTVFVLLGAENKRMRSLSIHHICWLHNFTLWGGVPSLVRTWQTNVLSLMYFKMSWSCFCLER